MKLVPQLCTGSAFKFAIFIFFLFFSIHYFFSSYFSVLWVDLSLGSFVVKIFASALSAALQRSLCALVLGNF
jgi:hypothetical protein